MGRGNLLIIKRPTEILKSISCNKIVIVLKYSLIQKMRFIFIFLFTFTTIEAYYNIYAAERFNSHSLHSTWNPYICILEVIGGDTLAEDDVLEPKLGFRHCTENVELINKMWDLENPYYGGEDLNGEEHQYVQTNLKFEVKHRADMISYYHQTMNKKIEIRAMVAQKKEEKREEELRNEKRKIKEADEKRRLKEKQEKDSIGDNQTIVKEFVESTNNEFLFSDDLIPNFKVNAPIRPVF